MRAAKPEHRSVNYQYSLPARQQVNKSPMHGNCLVFPPAHGLRPSAIRVLAHLCASTRLLTGPAAFGGVEEQPFG